MCPLIKAECIESKCKFWVESENKYDCIFFHTFYAVNIAEADFLKPMREKINKLKP